MLSLKPSAVLDTNAALDVLVFDDRAARALAGALRSGEIRWLACRRMRDELKRALGYPTLAKWNSDSERTLAMFDSWTLELPTPPPAPLNLRCSDPDDQIFMDLALASGARWLVTKDKALLRLARRCNSLGLAIVKPGDVCTQGLLSQPCHTLSREPSDKSNDP